MIAQPRRMHYLVDEGDPFLIAQRDYLRGLDCERQQLHVMCTERLEADYDAILRGYNVSSYSYKRVPNSTKIEHIRKRVSRVDDNSSLQQLTWLSDADQQYVRNIMYPWDTHLHDVACKSPSHTVVGTSFALMSKGSLKAPKAREMDVSGPQ